MRGFLVSLVLVEAAAGFCVPPCPAFQVGSMGDPLVQPNLRVAATRGFRAMPGENISGLRLPRFLRMGETGEAGWKDPAGALWEGRSKKSVHAATVDWVKNMVIGLNLCPFALESMPGLKVVVADVEDRDDALELIHEELIVLSQKPKDKPATTLITFPPKLFEQLRAADGMVDIAEDELGNFEEFLELAEEATNVCQELGEEVPGADDALLLTFHPDSTYSEVPQDPAEFSLRSPYPIIHLLRGCDVGAAEEACESQGKTTEDISLENEARLRGEGWKELGGMMKSILDKHAGK